jgi:hypothetical protein
MLEQRPKVVIVGAIEYCDIVPRSEAEMLGKVGAKWSADDQERKLRKRHQDKSPPDWYPNWRVPFCEASHRSLSEVHP